MANNWALQRLGCVTDEIETAARYRLHASELRIFAANREVRDIQQPLLKLADDYEHLADELEAIDRTNQAQLARRPQPS